jgi:galactose mutarotase-like enzyme
VCNKVNLAQHSYFNLNGHDGAGRMPPVDDHFVFLSADAFTPVSASL